MIREDAAPLRLTIPDWNPAWSQTAWDTSVNSGLEHQVFDLLLPGPQSSMMNMALDEMLLYRVAEGRRKPLIWFWDWTERCVVLGSYQSVGNEIDAEAMQSEGFLFTRRISGGGAMLVEPGRTITWSLILPEEWLAGLSYVQSFACLDQWCVRALRALGVPVVYQPINDIATPAGKLAGAAQCRRGKTILHHVTMAYDFDNDLMLRVMRLRRPVINPKGIPSAVKLVSPLTGFTSLPKDTVRDWLVSAVRQLFRVRLNPLTTDELDEAARRMRQKFATPEWRYRVE